MEVKEMSNSVYLEPLSVDYLNEVMGWINDEEIVRDFACFDGNISREEEKNFLEEVVNSKNDFVFAIHEPNGRYIGNIGLHDVNHLDKSGRLAIIIGKKEYWGQGYAQQAISDLLGKAFNELGLRKVWLKCLDIDEKVKHLYEKCGFEKRDILKNEYFLNEESHDMLYMSRCA